MALGVMNKVDGVDFDPTRAAVDVQALSLAGRRGGCGRSDGCPIWIE